MGRIGSASASTSCTSEDFPPDRVGAALHELPADRQIYDLVPA
jgi:hypothetical protein